MRVRILLCGCLGKRSEKFEKRTVWEHSVWRKWGRERERENGKGTRRGRKRALSCPLVVFVFTSLQKSNNFTPLHCTNSVFCPLLSELLSPLSPSSLTLDIIVCHSLVYFPLPKFELVFAHFSPFFFFLFVFLLIWIRITMLSKRRINQFRSKLFDHFLSFGETFFSCSL